MGPRDGFRVGYNESANLSLDRFHAIIGAYLGADFQVSKTESQMPKVSVRYCAY